jgi:hypothetical protein
MWPSSIHKKHWEKWVCELSTGCHLWIAGVDGGTGRPKVHHAGKTQRVSRVVCKEIHGLLDTQEACHKPPCNNKLCINPNHLYPGTHVQNEFDKGRGTSHRFVQNHKSGYRVRVQGESVGLYASLEGAIRARDAHIGDK